MVKRADDLRPLMLRIPEALRQKLEREAKKNSRSMNSEINRRLEQSFDAPEQATLIATATATKFMEMLNDSDWISSGGTIRKRGES